MAIGALQQCGGAWLPEISGPHVWSRLPEVRGSAWVLDMDGRQSLPVGRAFEAATVVVGPEGGFAPNELRDLERLGCRPWALGERVLRVETAAIVAAGLLSIGEPLPGP